MSTASVSPNRPGRFLHAGVVAIVVLLRAPGLAADVPSRTAPPKGIEISVAAREELTAGVAALGAALQRLHVELPADSPWRHYLPDVQILHKAVAWPLRYGEFFSTNDIGHGRRLLRLGQERAAALRRGEAPWLTQTGLVARGFVSALDGSIQPYGLVVPPHWRPGGSWPVLVWLHGRDNQLTELKFLAERTRSAGEFAPTNVLVVHPYGRYCNAFKFAGEVDVLESLAHATKSHGGDPGRTALAGFSMGGAGAWHLGAHHASRWRFVSPGAGFAETAEYTGILRQNPPPPDYEQTLWNWYDATAYAGNFFNTSLLAYSGELDPQIQAARIMGQALARTGLPLRHYVGPATAHRYEPATKSELAGHFDALWRTNPARTPGELRFTTFTLRYAEAGWLRLEELGTHWRVATVHARRQPWGAWTLATTNVTALSIDRAAIGWVESESPVLTIDADIVRLAASDNARVALRRRNGTWEPATGEPAGRKRPGVQGPIDDAFLGKFIFVRPTGKAAHPTVGSWVETELTRATNEWRAQFRGEVPVVEDRDLTDRELGEANLILWGDPTSNRVMARLRDQLPIGWDTRRMVVGDESWPAADHVPVLIIPNPWNPQRYVVLNSGFTFWSAGNLSNARQTPRLPDFAVRNVTTGGLIVQAGFFDEAWRLPVAR